MRYWLKTCPYCRRGDIVEEHDRHGLYVQCVQCGYILSDREVRFLFGTAIGTPDPLDATRERVAV